MFLLPDGRRVVPRTELTYPGITPTVLTDKSADPLKMSKNAIRTPVDHIMGDMEDACPYDLKGEPVRKALAEALNTLDFGSKVVTWRPNNIRSGLFEADVEYMMRHAVDKFHGMVMPKSFGPDDVRYVLDILHYCERVNKWKGKVALEVLIETPRGLEQIDAIGAELEKSGRGAGLIFGIADFSSFLGIGNILTDQHVYFSYAKQRTVIAAKAHGLHAIDNVYTRISRKTDSPQVVKEIEAGLREKNVKAANMGMDGTWVIHPSQADIANACFTPTDEEITTYKRALEQSKTAGGGAVMDPQSGEMIDDATIRIALQALSKAAQAGKVTWDYVRTMNTKLTEITGYDILGSGMPH